jgi:hypothetical protein
MVDWPIMFTPAMVRALMTGLKTQTRRRATGKTGKPTMWAKAVAGDRLWVREAHRLDGKTVTYRSEADNSPGRWRPGLHMPRWASRTTLLVTATRREQVQAISEDDARAEGISVRGSGSMKDLFRDQWTDMHGPTAWDGDLSVIVLTFDVASGNIDTLHT